MIARWLQSFVIAFGLCTSATALVQGKLAAAAFLFVWHLVFAYASRPEKDWYD